MRRGQIRSKKRNGFQAFAKPYPMAFTRVAWDSGTFYRDI